MLEIATLDVVFGVDVIEDQAVAKRMRAGGLDRPQRAGVTEQRRLDGIRRPLPRGTIVKNHIDLVHVDMVAKEPVTGPVLIGDRRCTREYRKHGRASCRERVWQYV